MSGGSYDYVYFRIEEFAQDIYNKEKDPKRAAFSELMMLCSKAAKKIEWVDSGDSGHGAEHEAIDNVFKFIQEDPSKIQKSIAYDNLIKNLKEYLEL